MRTTKQLVSIIQDYMPEVADIRVLGYLSRAYLELINSNSSQNVFYIDTVDADPLPILDTTVGDRKYALDENNLVDSAGTAINMTQVGVSVTSRKLRALFVESTNLNIDYRLDPYDPRGYPSDYGYWYRGRSFSKIPCQSYNQRGGQPATVLLFDDYDTNIYAEFYYTPDDLLNVTDIMLIDTDVWSDALIDGSVGYYEDVINGQSRKLDKFQSYWKRKYLNVGLDNLEDKIPTSFKARPIG
ncbi:MAG: hypothetical protein PF450_11875 [Bacteroidales bacterium]|jgi:hypothetical protein|nr:hypothetical protein [Bacteroidales bacterium]